jgi:predicted amidohydrolase YtcJ
MGKILDFPAHKTSETAPGGFLIETETTEPRRAVAPPPSPDEVAAANQRVNQLIAEEGFAERRGRGCDDVVHGRDTADAEFYRAFEGLLAVANSAYDPPRSPQVDAGIVVQSVIEVN